METIKFFVQFDNYSAKEEVLEAFKPHRDIFKCCRPKPDEKFYLNGKICSI